MTLILASLTFALVHNMMISAMHPDGAEPYRLSLLGGRWGNSVFWVHKSKRNAIASAQSLAKCISDLRESSSVFIRRFVLVHSLMIFSDASR
jgi:hypothetical protein